MVPCSFSEDILIPPDGSELAGKAIQHGIALANNGRLPIASEGPKLAKDLQSLDSTDAVADRRDHVGFCCQFLAVPARVRTETDRRHKLYRRKSDLRRSDTRRDNAVAPILRTQSPLGGLAIGCFALHLYGLFFLCVSLAWRRYWRTDPLWRRSTYNVHFCAARRRALHFGIV